MTANPPSDPSAQVDRIVRYLEENRGKFTDDALAQAVRAEGYPEAAVTEAFARYRANEGVAPVRARAKRVVLIAYLVVYGVLSLGMVVNGVAVGALVLLVSMAITLGLSQLALNRRITLAPGAQMGIAGLVVVPFVLLVIVGGLCLATGLPLRPITF